MGLDFLDLTFTIEDEHHLRLGDSLEKFDEIRETSLQRTCLVKCARPDWRAGKFYVVLRDQLFPICSKCERDLRGYSSPGQCPTCGKRFENTSFTWDDFRHCMSKVTGFRVTEIREDTWLTKDLGFIT
jgi:rubrerythrin